jgi:hypothetical protein
MLKIICTILLMFGVVFVDTHIFSLSDLEFWAAELALMILCAIFIKERFNEEV